MVYQNTATENGETITIVAAFNAGGKIVKTLIIFKGQLATKSSMVGQIKYTCRYDSNDSNV